MSVSCTPQGVLQGSVSSEAHKLDHPNGGKIYNHADLYLDPQLRETAMKIHEVYLDAGADILVTGTHRATNNRFISNNGADQLESRGSLPLDCRCQKWNQVAAEVARAVAGRDIPVLGSIAPLMNSDGSDNEAWRSLKDRKKSWAKERQYGQIDALLRAGSKGYNNGEPLLDGILLEAGMYKEEDFAIAEIVYEIRPDAILLLCHEVHGATFPDPDNKSVTLAELHTEIGDRIGRNTNHAIGLNCCTTEDIAAFIDSGDTPSVAYPNQANYSVAGSLRSDLEKLIWRLHEAESRGEDFASWLRPILDERINHSNEEFAASAKKQILAGVQIIGGCCGTGPEQTRIFKSVWNTVLHSSVQT